MMYKFTFGFVSFTQKWATEGNGYLIVEEATLSMTRIQDTCVVSSLILSKDCRELPESTVSVL